MLKTEVKQNIPKGWQKQKLSMFGVCIRGVSYSPKDLRTNNDNTSTILLRSNNIKEEGLNLGDIQIVSKERVKDSQFMRENDIFICMSNGSKHLVGKNVFIKNDTKDKYTIGAFCALYRVLQKNKVDVSFIEHLFKSGQYKSQIQDVVQGGNINNLRNSQIENLSFLFPLIAEQKRIAKILSVVDEEIQKTDEIVVVTEKLKKGLMQQLFTQGIGHKKFKKTKIGEIPVEWEILPLGSLFKSIIGGGTPSRKEAKFWGGNIPWMTVKDMDDRKFIDSTKEFITNTGLKESSSNLIPSNSIITSTRMGIGRFYINIVPVSINQDLKGLSVNKNYDLDFVYWLLSFVSRRLEDLGTGTTVKGIRLETFSGLELAVTHNAKEQKKIAEILSTVNEKIEINKKLKEKLILLKKGLMQDLLSGNKRVNI